MPGMRKRFTMDNLTIKTKLNLLVFFFLAAIALVGMAGWFAISAVGHALRDLGDRNLPAMTALGDVRLARLRVAETMQSTASWRTEVFEDQADKADALREAKGIYEDLLERQQAFQALGESAFKAYDALPRSAEEEALWSEFKTLWDDFHRLDSYQTKLAKDVAGAAEWGELKQRMNQFLVATGRWSNSLYKVDAPLDRLVELNQAAARASKAAGDDLARRAGVGMAGLFIVATALAFVLARVVMRSVVGSLNDMRNVILKVAEAKDFTLRAGVRGGDETAQTTRSFNLLLESMQTSLLDVMAGARGIGDTSQQISAMGTQVTDSAGAQAEASASMALAIEQMIANIGHIASKARDVLAQAQEASSAADSGATAIAQTTGAMEKISGQVVCAGKAMDALREESDRISCIVSVIREVADQTNLLALNAAIEAARAGEQGRGFAVVADEVRKLAERTTSSAQEIGTMIAAMHTSVANAMRDMEGVVSHTGQSKAMSEQAARHMSEISTSANRVSAAITEVTAALCHQEQAAQEIAARVEVVARLSERNNTTAARVAVLSAALDGATGTLHRVVDRFKL
ncbi:methyl-accepting chemotaxis protein [Dechloromonas agitata]|uniref:methyl-accepting chemotaxis protein n=1 Tax=Dechloromonas agitata TaxID=73030 RepID=UPI00237ED0FA|nr:methyl-accepting chemotaxis protein [Dechloromonas agitata]MDE1544008.1 methyl-accepting chemotaxis protein [Dechloromonas agitata]